ncbi:MAG TPA: Gfo/Idh/MocA family oxidoreductase, partial [Lapillicoccus sp.]|uniref:Gfo/Idh/MocA family oxidoreductase n=1 Tax=Lapillicoccus sp. TaxID=1909287 RepID=UPI002F9277F9
MRIGLAGVGRIGAFHAETLTGLDFVDELVVTDAFPEAAHSVADRLGVGFAETPQALLDSGVDAFVIATATPGHAPLLRLG